MIREATSACRTTEGRHVDQQRDNPIDAARAWYIRIERKRCRSGVRADGEAERQRDDERDPGAQHARTAKRMSRRSATMISETLAPLHRRVDRLQLGPDALRAPKRRRASIPPVPATCRRHEISCVPQVKAQLLVDIVSNAPARRRDVQRSPEAGPLWIAGRTHHAPSAAMTSPTASV